jgi:hypothetical protein
LLLPFSLAACEQLKSSNPLSPQVAGPMAGIGIDTPRPLAPGSGLSFDDKDQPLTLVVANPETNSPRPVAIDFEVAVDVGFTNVVISRNDVPQGAGQTSSRLDRLPTGRVYYWRVRGDDGVNTSDWSVPVYFELRDPIIIGVPTPKSPVGDFRVSNTTPELVVGNAPASGPHGGLTYQFQVSENQTFTSVFINDVTPQGAGETRFTVTFLTQWDRVFYWRSRAFAGAVTGDWSRTETFRSPTAPPVSPSPPPGSGGGSGPIGDTSHCNSLVGNKPALVQCIHAVVQPGGNEYRAFEVTKRVAWALRGEGGGMLIKNGGENILPWRGYSFSISRICYPDGHIFKVLSDAGPGGANAPTWSDNDFVDKSLYVPAIDPSLP